MGHFFLILLLLSPNVVFAKETPTPTISGQTNVLSETYRDAVAKAFMVRRYADVRSAGRELNAGGQVLLHLKLSKEQILGLEQALGALYETGPKFAWLTDGIRVTTAEYDERLAKAAEKANLGSDFPKFLREKYPLLLEGRLKASDATDPKHLKDNLPILKEMVRGNHWPLDQGEGGRHFEQMTRDYVAKISPQVWKSSDWRNFVKDILANGSEYEIKKFHDAVYPIGAYKYGHYNTLTWGLGDIYKEVLAENPSRKVALESLERAFPPEGSATYAKQILAEAKPTGKATDAELPLEPVKVPGQTPEIKKDIYSPYQPTTESTLADLKKIDPEVLSGPHGFYSTLTAELTPEKLANLNDKKVEMLVGWIHQRFKDRIASPEEIKLFEKLLPRAVEVAATSRNFDMQYYIKSLQHEVYYQKHWPKEAVELANEELKAMNLRSINRPDLQKKILSQLQSKDKEEIINGLRAIRNTGIGIGNTEIQNELANHLRNYNSTDLRIKEMDHRYLIVKATKTVLEPGAKVEGSLVRQVMNSSHLPDYLNSGEQSLGKYVDALDPNDVTYDRVLYERYSARDVDDPKDPLRDAKLKQQAAQGSKIPDGEDTPKKLNEHLKAGDEVAQKYILKLLQSSDLDEMQRGLYLAGESTVVGKSQDVQKALAEVYKKLDGNPQFSKHSRHYFVDRILNQLRGKEVTVVDPSLVKIALSLPQDEAFKNVILAQIDYSKMPYDEELRKLTKNYSSLDARDQAKATSIYADRTDYIHRRIYQSIQEQRGWTEAPVAKTVQAISVSSAKLKCALGQFKAALRAKPPAY